MALLIIVVAYYCVRNTTQDLIYAITGRVPPSFIREQNRIARREARRPISSDRGHRKFFRNAYNDAWETAEAHRARWAEKRAEKRHAKWGDNVGEPASVPAPVTTSARPEDKSVAPVKPAVGSNPEPIKAAAPRSSDDPEEAAYQRYAMRRRNGSTPDWHQLSNELDIHIAAAEGMKKRWDARYEKENPGAVPVGRVPAPAPKPLHEQIIEEDQDRRFRKESLVDLFGDAIVNAAEYEQEASEHAVRRRFADWFNGFSETKVDLSPEQIQAEYAEGRRLAAQAGITDMDKAREVLAEHDTDTPRQAHDRQVDALANAAAQNSRGDVRPSGSPSPDTKENSNVSNVETTGLQSGLAYNDEMAKTCEQGAASVEQSIAALENGEVGQSVTGPMQQGREHLEAAMACFQEAKGHLEQHITVQEAYSANPDAGNKQFVTAE